MMEMPESKKSEVTKNPSPMLMPKGYTEQQVLEIIEGVVNRLARKYVFGYYDIEDIKQEGRQMALKCLPKYDGVRPLENFIYTHVHNRLFNLRRDEYERLNKPCHTCEFYDKFCKKSKNECAAFEDKMECSKWVQWITRNSTKKNLMSPTNIEDTTPEKNLTTTTDFLESLSNDEILNIIDREISIEVRPLFIKFKNNIKLLKGEYKKLLEEIKKICQNKKIISTDETTESPESSL